MYLNKYKMEDRPILEFIDTYTPFLRIGTDCSGIEAPVQALRQHHSNMYSHLK
jgi:hypothetical protein